MKVRLTQHWNGNEAGEVLDLDPPVADLLIEFGKAVKVEGGKQKVQPQEIK